MKFGLTVSEPALGEITSASTGAGSCSGIARVYMDIERHIPGEAMLLGLVISGLMGIFRGVRGGSAPSLRFLSEDGRRMLRRLMLADLVCMSSAFSGTTTGVGRGEERRF